MAALVPVVPTIVEEQWVQCENPNCNKWRKLPVGAAAPKDDEPWFCYMNPDPQRNACSASEAEYDERNEMTLDPEDEEHNRMVRERLQASIAAAAAAAAAATAATRGRGRGRGKGRGGGRSKGRARGRGRSSGGVTSSLYPAVPQGWGLPLRGPMPLPGQADEDLAHTGGRGRAVGRKQQARHFQRLLENQGSWESGRGQAGRVLAAPPQEAWESLAQHAPELAEVACRACDLASSARYFEDQGPAGAAAAEQAASMARLALMLAAGAGLSCNADVLTEEEQHRFGLEPCGAASAPLAAGGLASAEPSSSAPPMQAKIEAGPQPARCAQQQQQQQQQLLQTLTPPAATAATIGAVPQPGSSGGAAGPQQQLMQLSPAVLQQVLMMQQRIAHMQQQPSGAAPGKPGAPLPAAANGNAH